MLEKLRSIFGSTKEKEMEMIEDTIETNKVELSRSDVMFPVNPPSYLKIDYKFIPTNETKNVVPFDLEYCLKNFIWVSYNKPGSKYTTIYFKNGTAICFNNWTVFVEEFRYTFFYFDSKDQSESYYDIPNNHKGYDDHYRFTDEQYQYIEKILIERLRNILKHNTLYARVNNEGIYVDSIRFNNIKENETVYLRKPDIGPKFPYVNTSLNTWEYCEAIILENGKTITNYSESTVKDRENGKYSASIAALEHRGYTKTNCIYDKSTDTFKRFLTLVDYKIYLMRKYIGIVKYYSSTRKNNSIDTFFYADYIDCLDIIPLYIKENFPKYSNDEDFIVKLKSKISDTIYNKYKDMDDILNHCKSSIAKSNTYDEFSEIEKVLDDIDIKNYLNFDYYKLVTHKCITELISEKV